MSRKLGKKKRICQWCCARCLTRSQERFSQRLLAVGLKPRDAQCWRCTARLSKHPDWAGVPLIERARTLADEIPGVTVAMTTNDITIHEDGRTLHGSE